ncbi:Bifunctional pinoresinol-lariciresinol reductase [Arachis hypogaea]|nr:Bifunctional pinoresinol-lariciresinol reductase [Arachis hypogaea]QHO22162.1 Bifunctional pinoresinol-lariciresinol reductase [Arachis hypogaea]
MKGKSYAEQVAMVHYYHVCIEGCLANFEIGDGGVEACELYPEVKSYPQTPYYQPPEQPPVSSYGHPPPSYGSAAHQPPPPYHIPPTSAAPYQPHQVHQQAPAEYGQPAYPRWRGPYYNAPAQQPGSVPRPPYTVPSPYPPPHQGRYYKQQ